MSWSAIVNAFRRLDDRLSDAVYLHGRCLTGQEKIVRRSRAEAAAKSLNLQTWAPGRCASRIVMTREVRCAEPVGASQERLQPAKARREFRASNDAGIALEWRG